MIKKSILSMPFCWTLVFGLFIRDLLNLPWLISPLYVLLMPVQKLHFIIGPSPVVVELLTFFLINIVVVICFLDMVPSLLFNYFSAFIIQHTLFGNSVYSLVIFIGLVLLRNGVSALVFTHIILKIIFFVYFAIRTNFRWTNKGLAYVRTLFPFIMDILVS